MNRVPPLEPLDLYAFGVPWKKKKPARKPTKRTANFSALTTTVEIETSLNGMIKLETMLLKMYSGFSGYLPTHEELDQLARTMPPESFEVIRNLMMVEKKDQDGNVIPPQKQAYSELIKLSYVLYPKLWSVVLKHEVVFDKRMKLSGQQGPAGLYIDDFVKMLIFFDKTVFQHPSLCRVVNQEVVFDRKTKTTQVVFDARTRTTGGAQRTDFTASAVIPFEDGISFYHFLRYPAANKIEMEGWVTDEVKAITEANRHLPADQRIKKIETKVEIVVRQWIKEQLKPMLNDLLDNRIFYGEIRAENLIFVKWRKVFPSICLPFSMKFAPTRFIWNTNEVLNELQKPALQTHINSRVTKMKQLYKQTLSWEKKIKDAGYNLVVQWSK